MTIPHFEMSFKLDPAFGTIHFLQLMKLMDEQLIFDESMKFDLSMQISGEERFTQELLLADLAERLKADEWENIHQLVLTHQWLKGMNIKIQLVRRPDGLTLNVKGEIDDVDARRGLTEKLNQWVSQQGMELSCKDPHTQDRERIFGSLLLTEPIIRATRQAFLSGQFGQALHAGHALLQKRLMELFGKVPADDRLNALFIQTPPLVIFPNLSGSRLRTELAALGSLCVGVNLLLKPLLEGKAAVSSNPTQILKYLVMIGNLLEYLEGATPNSGVKKSAASTRRTVPKTAATTTKTRKKPVKLRAGKTVKPKRAVKPVVAKSKSAAGKKTRSRKS